jgi:hypothetical protein
MLKCLVRLEGKYGADKNAEMETTEAKQRTTETRSVTFEILVGVSVKITWDMTPCSPLDHYRRFGGMCCLDLLGPIIYRLAHSPSPCPSYPTTELLSPRRFGFLA